MQLFALDCIADNVYAESETEGAVWSINTVCVAIVLYVVWASSYVR